jgi:hypothetical protein
MTRATFRAINSAISKHGVEIVKGAGYFYFAPLPDAPFGAADQVDSVYTPRLSDLSFDQWVAHVEQQMDKNERA